MSVVTELQLHEISFVAPELMVTARSRRHSVACSLCGRPRTRLHGNYPRTLTDLPWHGPHVRLEIRVRRLFCDLPTCPRRIFSEQAPRRGRPPHLGSTEGDVTCSTGYLERHHVVDMLPLFASPKPLRRGWRRIPLWKSLAAIGRAVMPKALAWVS
jgi:transposase